MQSHAITSERRTDMSEINALWGTETMIKDDELLRRRNSNREYMLSLKDENLLLNYEFEACRTNFSFIPDNIHGGWESPTCQLRGHFLGHFLSASAMLWHSMGDMEIKAKADHIVDEIKECQTANGGKWAASIPEKYFSMIAQGRPVWAPHYTVHKLFMGLTDMYRLAGNEKALDIADNFADWFYEYSGKYSREEFDDILDFETGGMLEIWAELLDITKDGKYRELLSRYYRGRLFDRLLAGEDPLTNMHANTTIPEILGCARAYEVTGGEKWLDIVKAYWKCAVTDRGTLATGGQTSGEIWMPMDRPGARLGSKNQEHCTVYNMMRLADFLFRITGEAEYMQYYEYNLCNGIMAQGYWHDRHNQTEKNASPAEGLLTYFLPMRAGSRKGWATRTDDFFCCHGTLVQANAILNRGIYYHKDNEIFVCQYLDSQTSFQSGGQTVRLVQKLDSLSGSFHLSSASPERQAISSVTHEYPDNPDRLISYIMINCAQPCEMKLHLRIPDYAAGEVSVTVNGRKVKDGVIPGKFTDIARKWKNEDTVCVTIPRGIHTVRLQKKSNMTAFMYGPLVLAGLCDEERTLYSFSEDPSSLLVHDDEREWGTWLSGFKTAGQERGIRFIPLNEVGYEAYTVYFPVG